MDSLNTITSPYDQYRQQLYNNGHHPLPIIPDTKTPGVSVNGEWRKMVGWQDPNRRVIETPQPGAGLGVRTGKQRGGSYLIGIDLDDDDVAIAAMELLPFAVAKAGKRGNTIFLRSDKPVLSRDFLVDGAVKVQILSDGRQSVISPTIHPDKKLPYVWETDRDLFNTHLNALPAAPDNLVELIFKAIVDAGFTADPEKPKQAPDEDGYDEFSPYAELNDLALRKLEFWVMDLGIYKCKRRRGPHATYDAVASWRPSSTGRPLEMRRSNLGITSKGIMDFGVGRGYSPIDLVMAARNWDRSTACDWLAERVRPQAGPDIDVEQIKKKAESASTESPTADPREEADKNESGGARKDTGNKSYKLLNYAEMLESGYSKKGAAVVDQLIRTGGLYSVNALPGGGKTSLLVELARCLTTEGQKFLERETHGAAVLYVPAEDPSDVRNRLEALKLIDVKMLMPDNFDDISLLRPRRFIATLNGAVADMRQLFPGKEVVIIYDTLRAGLGGKSVIKDEHTSPALVPLRQWAEQEDVVLFFSNHTNRSNNEQSKGETLESIAVLELTLVPDGNGTALHIGKNRFGPGRMRIGSVTFTSVDVNGVPASMIGSIDLSVGGKSSAGKPKSSLDRCVDELRKLLDDPAACVAHDVAIGGYAVRVSRWFAAVDETDILNGSDDRQMAFRNIRSKLRKRGDIGEDREFAWIAPPTTQT